MAVDPMLFALSIDDLSLMVFADPVAAIAHCEGIDVAEGGWRFWGSAGEPLEGVFSKPASRGRFLVSHGTYKLVPCADTGALPLRASLGGIRSLEPNPFFAGMASIQDHLSRSGSGPHPGA